MSSNPREHIGANRPQAETPDQHDRANESYGIRNVAGEKALLAMIDERLTEGDRWVLYQILRHMNTDTGRAFPSYAAIGLGRLLHERTVRKSIQTLEELGYIFRERKAVKDGGRAITQYGMTETSEMFREALEALVNEEARKRLAARLKERSGALEKPFITGPEIGNKIAKWRDREAAQEALTGPPCAHPDRPPVHSSQDTLTGPPCTPLRKADRPPVHSSQKKADRPPVHSTQPENEGLTGPPCAHSNLFFTDRERGEEEAAVRTASATFDETGRQGCASPVICALSVAAAELDDLLRDYVPNDDIPNQDHPSTVKAFEVEEPQASEPPITVSDLIGGTVVYPGPIAAVLRRTKAIRSRDTLHESVMAALGRGVQPEVIEADMRKAMGNTDAKSRTGQASDSDLLRACIAYVERSQPKNDGMIPGTDLRPSYTASSFGRDREGSRPFNPVTDVDWSKVEGYSGPKPGAWD